MKDDTARAGMVHRPSKSNSPATRRFGLDEEYEEPLWPREPYIGPPMKYSCRHLLDYLRKAGDKGSQCHMPSVQMTRRGTTHHAFALPRSVARRFISRFRRDSTLSSTNLSPGCHSPVPADVPPRPAYSTVVRLSPHPSSLRSGYLIVGRDMDTVLRTRETMDTSLKTHISGGSMHADTTGATTRAGRLPPQTPLQLSRRPTGTRGRLCGQWLVGRWADVCDRGRREWAEPWQDAGYGTWRVVRLIEGQS